MWKAVVFLAAVVLLLAWAPYVTATTHSEIVTSFPSSLTRTGQWTIIQSPLTGKCYEALLLYRGYWLIEKWASSPTAPVIMLGECDCPEEW